MKKLHYGEVGTTPSYLFSERNDARNGRPLASAAEDKFPFAADKNAQQGLVTSTISKGSDEVKRPQVKTQAKIGYLPGNINSAQREDRAPGDRLLFPISGQETMAIWPASFSYHVDSMLAPLKDKSFRDIVLMERSPFINVRLVKKIIFLLMTREDAFNPETGYMITAGGWKSLDLPFISGRKIDKIVRTQSFPGFINGEGMDNKFGTKSLVVIRKKWGKIVAEIPEKIMIEELMREENFGFQRKLARAFRRKRGVVGVWFIDYERLRNSMRLPLVTIENARDFAMTLQYNNTRLSSGALLEKEIKKTQDLAEIARKHGKKFVGRFDLHDWGFTDKTYSLRPMLGEEGELVGVFKRFFPAENWSVKYLKNENRGSIDPSTSDPFGPTLYVYTGTENDKEKIPIGNMAERKGLYEKVARETREFIAKHRKNFLKNGLEIVTCMGHAFEVKRRLKKYGIESDLFFWIDEKMHLYHVWARTEDGYIIDAYTLDEGISRILSFDEDRESEYSGIEIAKFPGASEDSEKWNAIAAKLEREESAYNNPAAVKRTKSHALRPESHPGSRHLKTPCKDSGTLLSAKALSVALPDSVAAEKNTFITGAEKPVREIFYAKMMKILQNHGFENGFTRENLIGIYFSEFGERLFIRDADTFILYALKIGWIRNYPDRENVFIFTQEWDKWVLREEEPTFNVQDAGIFSDEALRSYLCEIIRPGMDVADMGAAHGQRAVVSARLGARVDAIEIHRMTLLEAIERFKAQPAEIRGRIRAVLSDLFENSLLRGKKYDVIVFSPPRVNEKKPSLASDFRRIIEDHEFRLLGRFLDEAKLHLKGDGKIVLAYGIDDEIGDEDGHVFMGGMQTLARLGKDVWTMRRVSSDPDAFFAIYELTFKTAKPLGSVTLSEGKESANPALRRKTAWLESKYGDKLRDCYTKSPDEFLRFTDPDNLAQPFFAAITTGVSGEVIGSEEAEFCNYIIVLDKIRKKAALIHTDNYKFLTNAENALKKTCKMLDLVLGERDYIEKNTLAIIAKRPAISGEISDVTASKIEALFKKAANNLGLPLLETDTSRHWIKNKVVFTVDEGSLLALSPEGTVLRSIDMYEMEKKGRFAERRPVLRNFSEPEQLAENWKEAAISTLLSGRKIALFFSRKLRGYDKHHPQLRDDIEKWKENMTRKYPRSRSLMNNLITGDFETLEELNTSLEGLREERGVDLSDQSKDFIFTFEPENEKVGAENLPRALRPVYIKIKEKKNGEFRTNEFYDPSLDILTISVMAAFFELNADDIYRIFEGIGINRRKLEEDMNICGIDEDKNGNAFLIFTVIPRAKAYEHNGMRNRNKVRAQFTRAA